MNLSNDNLKLLPISDINWSKLISKLSSAHSAIARYDGRLESIPNPNVLLSPLMTKEAVLSSKIEGTQATLEEVLEFEADPDTETERFADIEEILNYRKALWHAESALQARPMSLNLVKEMHSILLDGVRGRDKSRGEFRVIQNWIGKLGTPIEAARYVPPTPESLPKALDNWEKYYHSDAKDILVQLAIIHAQFEIIHPFIDGNGRIGRILMPLFLNEKAIINSPNFYLSAYLEETRSEYYDRLLAITENGNWEDWIIYFLGAVSEQAKRNGEQAKKIMNLYDIMKEKVVELTRSRFAIQTIDFIFSNPIFRNSAFVEKSNIPKASAARIIKSLENGKIVKVIKPSKGNRPTVYGFGELLDIIRY